MRCEAIWLKRLLKDLRVEVSDPMMIYCDNLNNIQLANNPVFLTRNKHIKVHYHFVREHASLVKSNLGIFRWIRRLPTSSPNLSCWTSCNIF